MIEREAFLICRSPTATEAYRVSILLKEADKIAEKNRVTNAEMICLEGLWNSIKGMLENEELRNELYFDVERVRVKVERVLGR